ncbi:DUF5944 family protein [Actinomadura syzygii]|uniref:Uncharacterized protein n=1 Tax=Actinomadura syzygii TaxID=1427538 RepID=A0A5D0UAB6_9ACTN|nr:DUF5944 family protein [Actinomadura syzygii]TYC15037.1 hypothetical protein FXF65_12985 [Actinomadura syzygii]
MVPSFVARPSLSVVRKEDFADTSLIPAAFARHVTSRCLPPDRSPVHCSYAADEAEGGVRLRFSSKVPGLDEPTLLTHRFFFVDRDETRERLHLVTPEEPEVASEVLVLMDGAERDYCHASVYDGENRLLAVHAIVFDQRGRTVPYPFTERYVSPHTLGRADLDEVTDDAGRRALRFTVGLTGLTGPVPIAIAWQSMGRIDRRELTCTPEAPEAHHEIALDANPLLAPGDWVVIAVDEHEGFLAQSLVSVQPAG